MSVIKKLVTLLRGSARELGQSVVDGNATRIYEQEIIDAKSSITEAKTELTGVMAKQMQTARDIERIKADMLRHEDMAVQAIKVGFVGSPENLSAIAEIASDYPDLPLVAYMPSLAWWNEVDMENYLDAFAELLLPQTTVLVGNHSTLCRWLLPEWEGDRPPNAREIARAAAVHGVPYTLVTGFNAADQYLESHLATPETVLATARYERFEATFTGAGDTLSAALAALIAVGADLQTACAEALTYLDQCLDAGFQPGMGHAMPDRLFWAHDGDEYEEDAEDSSAATDDFPVGDTKH